MSIAAIRRMVEAFFRRWPFYLLLFIGSFGFGVYTVSQTVDEYTSTGSIFVDYQSLVTVQSGVQDGGFFSYLTPAQFTSQELNGLVGTDVFMESALELAGVDLATDPTVREGQIKELRNAVTSYAQSESLVTVVVTTSDPELSSRLAKAIADEFVQFQIQIDIAESGASEEFFAELVESYREDLTQAQADVDTALRGVGNLEELTPERQAEIKRLQDSELLAENRFLAAVDDLEASRLATLQSETDVRQSYSVVDPPQAATEPNASLVDDIIVLSIFAVVGLLLALMGPIVSAMLNRSVLFPEDVGPYSEVLEVIPKVRRKHLKLEGAVPTGHADAGEDDIVTLGQRTITFLPPSTPTVSDEPSRRGARSARPGLLTQAEVGNEDSAEPTTIDTLQPPVSETETEDSRVADEDQAESTTPLPTVANEDDAESTTPQPTGADEDDAESTTPQPRVPESASIEPDQGADSPTAPLTTETLTAFATEELVTATTSDPDEPEHDVMAPSPEEEPLKSADFFADRVEDAETDTSSFVTTTEFTAEADTAGSTEGFRISDENDPLGFLLTETVDPVEPISENGSTNESVADDVEDGADDSPADEESVDSEWTRKTNV
jgi:hypothetical protein